MSNFSHYEQKKTGDAMSLNGNRALKLMSARLIRVSFRSSLGACAFDHSNQASNGNWTKGVTRGVGGGYAVPHLNFAISVYCKLVFPRALGGKGFLVSGDVSYFGFHSAEGISLLFLVETVIVETVTVDSLLATSR